MTQDYIGELFGLTLFAIIFHYLGKWFRKGKLERKEEFEKYVAENGSTENEDYNYKKYLMNISATRYRGISFAKWMMIVCACVVAYKLIS